MVRSWLPLLAACSGGATPAVTGHDAPGHGEAHAPDVGHGAHRFDDPERWAAVFDDPERDAWQKPEALVAALGIAPGDVVADIGAGTGYFNRYFSAAVGPTGQVWALDVEASLVEHMAQRATDEQTPNVHARVVDPARPEVPADTDWVVLVDTYHHIEDRQAYFTALREQVASARLVVVDFLPGELPVGPPPDHKIRPDVVRSELESAGWRWERSVDGLLPYQFVYVLSWDRAASLSNPPPEGWVDLRAALPGAMFDIRYHTADNFVGAPLPGYGAPGAWLQEEPAAALAAVHAELASHGYGIKVYDAYRPLRGTQAMVAWAHRTDQVDLLDNGYIARRSGHNRGNTVDVSIFDLATGQEPDMGTAWDTLSEASHTRNAEGDALERRMLLRRSMEAHGWEPYWKEWWHFSFPMDGDLRHRDVPYGCFEPPEGSWTAPEGWHESTWQPPASWPRDATCPTP